MVTRPYLGEISAAEEVGSAGSTGDAAAPVATATGVTVASGPDDASMGRGLDVEALRRMQPATPTDVVLLAAQHLGADQDEVRQAFLEVCGPARAKRSKAECVKAWNELITQAAASSRAA
jgi:hypothetical protein